MGQQQPCFGLCGFEDQGTPELRACWGAGILLQGPLGAEIEPKREKLWEDGSERRKRKEAEASQGVEGAAKGGRPGQVPSVGGQARCQGWELEESQS